MKRKLVVTMILGLFMIGILSVALNIGSVVAGHIIDTMDADWNMSFSKGLDGYVDYGYSADVYTSAPESIFLYVWGSGTRGQDFAGVTVNKTFSWTPSEALVRLKLNYMIGIMTDGDAWGGMAVLTWAKVITHDAAGTHEYSYIVAGATTDVADWSYYMCQDYGPNVKYINWNNEEIPAPGHGELEPPTDVWYTLDRNVDADFDVDWSTVTQIEIRFDHGGGYLHQDQFKVYFDDLDLEGQIVAPPLSVSISPLSASILVGQSVIFTSTVSGGYTPYTYQWYLNGAPVSGATSASWTFTPTTSGIYYVYLKVIDAEANTSQSDAARIAVESVPVGGYSIPIQVHTKAEPILPYIALVVALTAILSLRRKMKRKR